MCQQGPTWAPWMERKEQPAQPSDEALTQALRERDTADDYIDALLDEVLGTDRPEWSSAYGRADAIEQVRERITVLMKPSVDKAFNRFESEMKAQPAQPEQTNPPRTNAEKQELREVLAKVFGWEKVDQPQHDPNIDEPPTEDLYNALAEIRNIFPAPERGEYGEHEFMEAVSDPLAVPAYVKVMVEKLRQKD